MDTEQFFLFNENTPSIKDCEVLDEEDLSQFKAHVEYCRHIKEIYGLFFIFNIHLTRLLTEYHLYSNGRAFREGEEALSIFDYYNINAHTRSILSAGQTLKESMLSFAKNNFPEDSKERTEYISTDRKIYDGSFAFSFLVRLRDYSQHGHLPVTCNNGLYLFDLKVISKKPHFNHNKNIKEKMDEASSMLIRKYKECPTIPLTTTLSEYVSNLLYLTNYFFTFFRQNFIESDQKYNQIIQKYPNNSVEGAFVYDCDGENIDIVSTEDKSIDMFETYSKDVAQFFAHYSSEWTKMQTGAACFVILNGKRFENPLSKDYFASYENIEKSLN